MSPKQSKKAHTSVKKFSCAKETLYRHAKSALTLRKSVSHLAQHVGAKFTCVYKLLSQLTDWLLLSERGRVQLRKSHPHGIQGHWFYARLKKKKAHCSLIRIHLVNNSFRDQQLKIKHSISSWLYSSCQSMKDGLCRKLNFLELAFMNWRQALKQMIKSTVGTPGSCGHEGSHGPLPYSLPWVVDKYGTPN